MRLLRLLVAALLGCLGICAAADQRSDQISGLVESAATGNNVLQAGLVDPMVLPTRGFDTIPLQTKLARGFGDDVFRDVGCRAGIYMPLETYLTTLGLDSTANFLGDLKTFEADGGRTVVSYFDFGPSHRSKHADDKADEKAVLFLAGLGSLMQSWSPVLLQGLATSHRVVMLDYPGQGMSKVALDFGAQAAAPTLLVPRQHSSLPSQRKVKKKCQGNFRVTWLYCKGNIAT